MNKLEILLKPADQWKTSTDIAIHLKEPTYSEILDGIDTARKGMFPRVVIYSKVGFDSRSNIKHWNSTWSKLIKDFPDWDIRAGEVGFRHGTSDGDGFTIYAL